MPPRGETVVTLPTLEGPAEARRASFKPGKPEPWRIALPWGDQTFYGSKPQVTAYMRRLIEEYEAAEPPMRKDDF